VSISCTYNGVCVFYELRTMVSVYSISCTYHGVCVLYKLYVPWCLCTLSAVRTMVSVYSISCTYHNVCVPYKLYVPWCRCTLSAVRTIMSVYLISCTYHGVCVLYQLVLSDVLALSCILQQVPQKILEKNLPSKKFVLIKRQCFLSSLSLYNFRTLSQPVGSNSLSYEY
jgi:hypothetical protein